jgi:protein subunit release factor A
MTIDSETVLRAWLVDEATNGHFFLADVWKMLGIIADRAGCELTPLSSNSTAGRATEYRAALRGQPPPALRREFGVHRAQWVPLESETGRVETSLVGVEIISDRESASSSRPGGQVLKTYNYPQRWVISHASGDKYPLETILSGETG